LGNRLTHGINPVVKRMMVESWFLPENSTGSILQPHMYFVAGLIPQKPLNEYILLTKAETGMKQAGLPIPKSKG